MIKKYAFLVLVVGGVTFLLIFYMIMITGGKITTPAEYPNKQGFSQALFWFELLESPDEVQLALGDPSTDRGRHIRQVMDTVNTYDFIFMVFYPLLYTALILFLHKKLINDGYKISYHRVLVGLGIVFSIVMLLGDIYENIQLFKISSYHNIMEINADIIHTLQIATRIKSIAINAGTLILIYFYFRYFNKSWKILLPILYSISVVLSVVALTVSSMRFLIEFAASIGMFGWLLSTIHGAYWYFKTRTAL